MFKKKKRKDDEWPKTTSSRGWWTNFDLPAVAFPKAIKSVAVACELTFPTFRIMGPRGARARGNFALIRLYYRRGNYWKVFARFRTTALAPRCLLPACHFHFRAAAMELPILNASLLLDTNLPSELSLSSGQFAFTIFRAPAPWKNMGNLEFSGIPCTWKNEEILMEFYWDSENLFKKIFSLIIFLYCKYGQQAKWII